MWYTVFEWARNILACIGFVCTVIVGLAFWQFLTEKPAKFNQGG